MQKFVGNSANSFQKILLKNDPKKPISSDHSFCFERKKSKMIRFNFLAMIRRREFRFAFLFMMAFASGYPIWLVLKKLVEGADIGSVCDPRYAFIFFQYNDIFDIMPFLLPILTLFPAALPYITDRRTRYDSVLISRCGIRKYLFSNAVLALIIGFGVVFIPSLWNIFLNRMLLPQTFCSFIYNDYYNDFLDASQENISRYQLLWFVHPLISDVYSAFRIGLLTAILSLVTYVSSTYIKPKYGFISVIPVFMLLFVGNLMQDLIGSDDFFIDILSYTGSASTVSGMFFFYSEMLVLSAISLIMLYHKSKKDMI